MSNICLVYLHILQLSSIYTSLNWFHNETLAKAKVSKITAMTSRTINHTQKPTGGITAYTLVQNTCIKQSLRYSRSTPKYIAVNPNANSNIVHTQSKNGEIILGQGAHKSFSTSSCFWKRQKLILIAYIKNATMIKTVIAIRKQPTYCKKFKRLITFAILCS